MIHKSWRRQLVFIFSALIMVSVNAEMSEHHAAIVKANETTQALISEQNFEAALRNAESTYALSMRTLGENDPNTANLAMIYANLVGATGDDRKAYELYSRATKIFETLYGANSLKLVPALIGMGEFERRSEQLMIVQRALEIQRSEAPEDKLGYANSARLAGEYLVQSSRTRIEAQKLLNEALTIYENEYGENATELIDSLMLLGNAAARWGKSRTPKRYYKRALSIAKEKLSEDQHATLLQKTGSSLLRYSASSDARSYLSKAHKMFQKLHGDSDRRTALSALALGRYYMAAEKYRTAEPLLIQALDFVETNPNYRNHQMATLSLLVELHEQRGNREKATPYCQAIGEISPWTDTQDYKPIFKRAPDYPSSAARTGSEGYVLIEYTVDANGFVQNPKVIEFDGPESFQTASLEAVERFRYAPAFVDGNPTSTDGVRNKFTFELAN